MVSTAQPWTVAVGRQRREAAERERKRIELERQRAEGYAGASVQSASDVQVGQESKVAEHVAPAIRGYHNAE
jgi:hypothetical protein